MARWAPSPHGAQPWRVVVLTRPEAKRALAEAMGDRPPENKDSGDANRHPRYLRRVVNEGKTDAGHRRMT
jgi:nitroreductase